MSHPTSLKVAARHPSTLALAFASRAFRRDLEQVCEEMKSDVETSVLEPERSRIDLVPLPGTAGLVFRRQTLQGHYVASSAMWRVTVAWMPRGWRGDQ